MLEDVRVAEKVATKKGYNLNSLDPAVIDKDNQALTLEDLSCLKAGQPLPTYNAFVLHGDEEEEFVLDTLVPNMEAQGIRVLLKDRDMLPGTLEHESVRFCFSVIKLVYVYMTEVYNSLI